jgi:hypothetical protein
MMMPGPQTPPAWRQQTQAPRSQPPPGYAPPPPPQRKSNNAALFVGLGCVVALLLVVGLPIALAAGFLHKAQGDLGRPPTYSPSHYGVPDTYVGTWQGSGADTSGSAKGKSFKIKITLSSHSTFGSVQYGVVGSGCSGSLFMDSTASSDTKVGFRETLTNTAQTHCPVISYVTLTLNGSTMAYELRNASSDSSPLSTGSLSKG